MEIEITGVSVYIRLVGHPQIPVNPRIPYMINIRDNGDVERVILADAKLKDIPKWVYSSRNRRWVYTNNNMVVECTYYYNNKILVCRGANNPNLDSIIDEMLIDLKTSYKDNNKDKRLYYKASNKIDITESVPWNFSLFSHVITNDPKINSHMVINEIKSPLYTKRLMTIFIKVENCVVRAIVTPKSFQSKRYLIVKLTKIPNTCLLNEAYNSIIEAMKQYESSYNDLLLLYPHHKLDPSNIILPILGDNTNSCFMAGIKNLRKELPEFFVNNYTRECPVLPVMVTSKKEAENLKKTGYSVIQYPYDDLKYSRYYTSFNKNSPFVGLKINRLSNNTTFPYLVTCFKLDQMNKPGSCTNEYYTKIEYTKQDSNRVAKMPKFISFAESGYYVKSIHKKDAFISALEFATNTVLDRKHLPWFPQIVRQEEWKESDETIMNKIRNYNDIIGSKYFRYFEEILKKSIHVITFKKGKKSMIPEHIPPYIWGAPYSEHIVIFENINILYKKTVCKYRVLVRQCDNSPIFDNNDTIIKFIVKNKESLCMSPTYIKNVTSQIIDKHGKCRIVSTNNNQLFIIISRPYMAPIMEEPRCFLYDHISKMNTIKSLISLPTTDPTKLHTEGLIYFPNNHSFISWVNSQYPPTYPVS